MIIGKPLTTSIISNNITLPLFVATSYMTGTGSLEQNWTIDYQGPDFSDYVHTKVAYDSISFKRPCKLDLYLIINAATSSSNENNVKLFKGIYNSSETQWSTLGIASINLDALAHMNPVHFYGETLDELYADRISSANMTNITNIATTCTLIAYLTTEVGDFENYKAKIMGAPRETVSYAGPVNGSVILDGYGDARLTNIPSGTYTFTGSISGTKSNVSVTNQTDIGMWPDGARIIYWYGRMGLLDDGITKQAITVKTSGNANQTNNYATPYENYIKIYTSASLYNTQKYYGTVNVHFGQISYQGYSNLTYIVSDRSVTRYNTNTASLLGQKSAVDTTACPNEFTEDGTYTYELDTTKPYIVAGAKSGSTSAGGSGIQYFLKAIYLS